MPVSEQECKRQLEAGFGSPELAAILRPIAMDPQRLADFVKLWNSNSVESLGDVIVTQYVVERSGVFQLPQAAPIPLSFQDDQALDIVRMTISANQVGGGAIDPDLMLVDITTGTRTTITERPVPASHIMGNGINSWLCPVPIRLGIKQSLDVGITFLPGVIQATDIEVFITLHCLRLCF